MRANLDLTRGGLVIALLMATGAEPAASQRIRCGTRSTAPCSAPGFAFVTVSAGHGHSCGVTRDGTAYCWGDGREGALGDGRGDIQRLPQRVSGSTRFADIAAGGDFTCARSVDHQLSCWGKSQAVPGWPEVQRTPVPVPHDGEVRAITVGGRHACTLDAEGRARCWGFNVDGETGTGSGGVDVSMIATPAPVATTERFAMMSAGMGFTCGVTTDGAVLCWGSNIDGIVGAEAPDRCGDVTPIPCATRPVRIAVPERAKQVSSGTGHACAVTVGGTVYCWGATAPARWARTVRPFPRCLHPGQLPSRGRDRSCRCRPVGSSPVRWRARGRCTAGGRTSSASASTSCRSRWSHAPLPRGCSSG